MEPKKEPSSHLEHHTPVWVDPARRIMHRCVMLTVLATNYLLKVLWEAFLTPVTYRIVGVLKRAEGVDVYDKDTAFTPFSIKS